jgi:NAD(P)-dependent dehydrogenase (short-subunit alcohol dehydrogenase family)
VDINLNGPYYIMRAFCPRMAGAGGGSVINISSGAAISPEFGRVSYTVTKAALESFTQGIAYELQDDRIAVNCIRLELSVWSEGYAFTLPGVDTSEFEDPVIMSDAALWLATQPKDYTGHIVTIGELREAGAVRPRTRISDRARSG